MGKKINRRHVLAASAFTVASNAFAAPRTKMTIQLSCGSIGVKADQQQAIDYASKFGYDSVEADSNFLASLDESALKRFLDDMKSKNVVWGNAGMPVEFRRDEETFRKGMTDLPRRAKALQQAGVTRVTTWISPASDELTYLENLKQHGRRLREVATVLEDHGCRFGLEYVGPKLSRIPRKFAFVHCMREMRELIAEINKPNMGFVMDSWHWYTAGEGIAELKTLTNKDVVSIDLNDAPTGLPLDKQVDSQRELPCATGMIPIADFLNTLNSLGCDAPARCEPFNAPLRAMTPEQALQATVTAMKKAFDQIK